jgi:hypothetical protein
MESANPGASIDEAAPAPGLLYEIGWILSGAVLPIASLAFYREASRRPILVAIGFLLLFTSTMALISSLTLGLTMMDGVQGIRDAYDRGIIPPIAIEHGITRIHGPETVILLDQPGSSNSMLVAIDISGRITEIDRSRYQQGFLLTRTELHALNDNGDYNVFPLSELHSLFNQDPILINARTVAEAWTWISIISVLTVLVVLVGWHFGARLMFLAAAGLLIWGFITLLRPKSRFEPVLAAGVYASVPAIYVSHLLSRSGISFFGLQTFLLMVFWGIALFASLADLPFLNTKRPLRLWTAVLGLPLIILIVVDAFRQFDGALTLWITLLSTVLVIAGLRLFYRSRDARPDQPVTALGV